MIGDMEQRLIRLRNELKAQKVASELAYSSILWPANTPQQSWTGTITFPQSPQNVIARLRVRFTRTDGVSGAPFVDFAQNVTYTPTYYDYSVSQGWTVTGNDINYVDDQAYTGYIAAAGSNYVDYYVDFLRDLESNYFTLNSVQVTLNVEAISMVEGSLTITRLI